MFCPPMLKLVPLTRLAQVSYAFLSSARQLPQYPGGYPLPRNRCCVYRSRWESWEFSLNGSVAVINCPQRIIPGKRTNVDKVTCAVMQNIVPNVVVAWDADQARRSEDGWSSIYIEYLVPKTELNHKGIHFEILDRTIRKRKPIQFRHNNTIRSISNSVGLDHLMAVLSTNMLHRCWHLGDWRNGMKPGNAIQSLTLEYVMTAFISIAWKRPQSFQGWCFSWIADRDPHNVRVALPRMPEQKIADLTPLRIFPSHKLSNLGAPVSSQTTQSSSLNPGVYEIEIGEVDENWIFQYRVP
jgi:hypothetical protein